MTKLDSLTPIPEAEHLKNWGQANPEISIICACYNHISYIENTLRGFLGQQVNVPFEIIIRDDASTDGTAEIIKAYQQQYPTIIRAILESENTFQKGLKPAAVTYPLARGKYIALCDGDDYWTDPTKLQQQYDYLQANSAYILCCHAQILEHYKDGIIPPKQKSQSHDISAQQLQQVALLGNSTLFFRNVVQLMPLEFYRVANGDLFLTSFLGGFGKGRFINEIRPSIYHFHGKGVWSSKSQQQQNIALAITHLQLSSYYDRTGNEQKSAYFLTIASKKIKLITTSKASKLFKFFKLKTQRK